MKFILFLFLIFISNVSADFNEKVFVSPDGKKVYATFKKGVLYTLDGKDLKVIERKWLGHELFNVLFSADGKTVIVHNWKGIQTVDSEFKPLKKAEVGRTGILTQSPDRQSFYGISSLYEEKVHRLTVFDMKLEKLKIIDIPYSLKIIGQTFSSDSKNIVLVASENENKKNCFIITYNVKSGKQISKKEIPYFYPRNKDICSIGSDTYIFDSSEKALKIDKAGKIFEFGMNKYYKILAYNQVAKVFAVGNLRTVAYMKQDSLKPKEIVLDRLEGWPEYIYGASFTDKGVLFCVSSGNRIIKISAEGTLLLIKPVL